MPSKYDLLPAGANPLDVMRPGLVRPSAPDPRDFGFLAHAAIPGSSVQLPRKFELPRVPVRNQQDWGACGAFGSISQYEYEMAKLGVAFDGSEQAQYAWTRLIQNTLCQDSGSDPRSAMQAMVKYGVLTESEAPYQQPKDLCWQPGDSLTQTAASRRITAYAKTAQDMQAVKAALYGTNGKDGRVVSACHSLFRNFAPDANGVIPMPGGPLWGGHWMSHWGWDDDLPTPYGPGAYLYRNQWSAAWGLGGYCWMPYAVWSLGVNQGGVWPDLWVVTVKAPDPQPSPTPTPATTAAARVWSSVDNGAHWIIQSVDLKYPEFAFAEAVDKNDAGTVTTQHGFVRIPY